MTTSTKTPTAKKDTAQGRPLSEITGAVEALATNATVTGMTYKLESQSDAAIDAAYFLAAGESATVQSGRAFAVFDGSKGGAAPVSFLALEVVKISGPAVWCPIESDETLETLAPRLIPDKIDLPDWILVFCVALSGSGVVAVMIGAVLEALGASMGFITVSLAALSSIAALLLGNKLHHVGLSEARDKVTTLVAKTRTVKTPEKIAALEGSHA